MEARPIDANVLLDGLDENCGDLDLQYNSEYAKLVHYIDSQPTLDYEPVRHGEWIMVSPDGTFGVCKACNRSDHIDPLATHCRYCGAKMGKGDA